MTQRTISSTRTLGMVAGLASLVACAGGGQTRPAPQAPGRNQAAPTASAAPASPSPVRAALTAPSPADWLVVDSASRTATITLEATRPSGAASALLNGYRSGEARVIVPTGWTVKWNWRNSDSTSPHSLAIMTQREKIPLEGGRPAFINAMTRMLTGGLPAGETDQTTFVADEGGWFWILCGVPEHALQGEWLELKVDQEASTASVDIKQKPAGNSP
jgi:hypothetical protein